MKPSILLLGAGMMGQTVAHYLCKKKAIYDLIWVDLEKKSLPDLNLIEIQIEDVRSPSLRLQEQVKNASLIIAAMPWYVLQPVFSLACEARTTVITVCRPHYSEMPAWNQRFLAADTSMITGVGLEPGLCEVFSRYLLQKLPDADQLEVQCGGIPKSYKPPFGYARVFGGNALPFEDRPTYTVENGQMRSVPRFSGIETWVEPSMGELEAWHDGLIPWVYQQSPFSRLTRFSQKTIRWAGYASKVRLMHDLGLLESKKKKTNWGEISGEEWIQEFFKNETTLGSDERDIVLLNIRAQSPKGQSVSLHFRDERPAGSPFTAMARITGFTAGIAAEMILLKRPSPGLNSMDQWLCDPNGVETLLRSLQDFGMQSSISAPISINLIN